MLQRYQLKNMTTSSMADIYMMLRNKSKESIQSFKPFKHNNYGTDSKECVSCKICLMEAGRANEMRAQEICPPPWTGLFKDAQYSIGRSYTTKIVLF